MSHSVEPVVFTVLSFEFEHEVRARVVRTSNPTVIFWHSSAELVSVRVSYVYRTKRTYSTVCTYRIAPQRSAVCDNRDSTVFHSWIV